MSKWTVFGRGTRVGILGEPQLVSGSYSTKLPFYQGHRFLPGQALPAQMTEDGLIYLRIYRKEDDVSSYFKLLRSCSHPNIINVVELLEDAKGNKAISFERVHCSLKNFIIREAENLRTPNCPGQTVDFSSPMIRVLKQIASGISYLHKRDRSLGSLQLDSLYLKFDHTYKPHPAEEHFATVKLLPGHEIGCTQDKDALKKKDWILFGHMVEEVSVILCVNENIEIRSMKDKLISGHITDYEELFREPAIWYGFQKTYFLHHMFEALEPNQFVSASFRGWTADHEFLLSRYPLSQHDASKDDKTTMVDNEADARQYWKDTFFGFYNCLRLTIVHFEREKMFDVRKYFSGDIDRVVRSFQGYHPTLLLDLIKIARNGDPRSKMVLKGLIKKITFCQITS